MRRSPPPFAAHEWLIAWRYLRARRREGGVSVMTWISLIGIALAVFALIATLAVRTGFRTEFVGTVLGANAHVAMIRFEGGRPAPIADFDARAAALRAVPGVVRAAPLVRGQVMATANGRNTGVEIYGERPGDVATLPLIARPKWSAGDLSMLGEGVAVGEGVARQLGLFLGDTITLISPEGAFTPFGRSLRVNAYRVVYIFRAGRYDIDNTRIYMPLAAAQEFLNHDGTVDQIEVMVADPDAVGDRRDPGPMDRALAAAAPGLEPWTWKDSSGAFLDALTLEDNVMFVVLSILVLVAALNITSGLVMLVRNKGRDIGILRTMGLTEGAILRIFFLCGALVGVAGTAAGVVLGTLFATYIDPIFAAFTALSGGGWDPAKYGLSQLPARLVWWDVLRAAGLSLGLSFLVTLFPARRAARMNPVEALRYE
ncbi:MAG: FtsX-like permease family protein [Alphaproteobacteria bacterium]|nr:MAG: FtsX-like permease family protein [Alphaproteobacteria bacterium]